MRVLLYGMQSSGASLVTFFLGQAPRSVALIDVWARHLTPPLAGSGADGVIAKCVVTTEYDFDDHVRSFRPDRTILVLRHPVQNYESLRRKDYAAEGGAIDEKFARLEAAYRERDRFDLVLAYESFVRDPEGTVESLRSIGLRAESGYYRFPRSTQQIKSFNVRTDPWCRERFGFGWGYGNVQGTQLDPSKLHRPSSPEAEEHVRRLCPSVCEHYDERFAWLGEDAATAGTACEAPSRRLPKYIERLLSRIA